MPMPRKVVENNEIAPRGRRFGAGNTQRMRTEIAQLLRPPGIHAVPRSTFPHLSRHSKIIDRISSRGGRARRTSRLRYEKASPKMKDAIDSIDGSEAPWLAHGV